MSYRIIKGKIERFCEHYKGELFHAVLCDAPYEMAFMNRSWDASGVSFNPDTWRGIADLLYPGGFLFVFAGTLNDDLISVAMRKAGLRKLHKVLGYVFGSGFPKATRIDTQIDKAAGAKRERIPATDGGPAYQRSIGNTRPWMEDEDRTVDSGVPVTELAKAWEGHRYGGQAMKPAIEPVLVFQKPYEGKPVDCITETGAGALNIDGSRIPTNGHESLRGGLNSEGYTNQVHEGWDRPWRNNPETLAQARERSNASQEKAERMGRWPAHFFTEHHPECTPKGTKDIKNTSGSSTGNEPSAVAKNVYGKFKGRTAFEKYGDENGLEVVTDWDCHPDCPVRRLGEQSGERPSGVPSPHHRWHVPKMGKGGVYGDGEQLHPRRQYGGDTGTAARYFFQSHYLYERLENTDPILYCPKASRKERDAGCNSLPDKTRNRVNPGGLEHDPKFAPVQAKNIHPSVKPIALTKWLATLLLPPDEYNPRRLLIPFAGSGSEMIGALLAGWEHIVGVELLQENVDIARTRLAWWEKWIRMGCTDPATILKEGVALEKNTPENQLSLFD